MDPYRLFVVCERRGAMELIRCPDASCEFVNHVGRRLLPILPLGRRDTPPEWDNGLSEVLHPPVTDEQLTQAIEPAILSIDMKTTEPVTPLCPFSRSTA